MAFNLERDNRKIIRAWTFYDWANSSFPLVINSAIFPIFYDAKVSRIVNIGGIELPNSVFYSYVVSFSLLVVFFSVPLLSGIADYVGNRKHFLQFFCYLGAISCMGLFFFDEQHLLLSMLPFMLATIGYWSSIVFYNSYLPEIAHPRLQDRVSAKGFALGYLGSSLLLILNLIGLTQFQPPYSAFYSFLSVGIWWLAFAQITFRRLPPPDEKQRPKGGRYIFHGFRELSNVYKEVRNIKHIRRYLFSFFFTSMGVQTVMYVAVLFAGQEIQWDNPDFKKTALIVSILLIQFLGIGGSFVFSYISERWGNIKALGLSIFIWILICLGTYFFVHLPTHFFIVAASVGLVMGGVQSLSRSTYSKFITHTKEHTSYFSFYDALEKLGIVCGVFAFGYINQLTGSMRASVVSLVVFFIVGFVLLIMVPKEPDQE